MRSVPAVANGAAEHASRATRASRENFMERAATIWRVSSIAIYRTACHPRLMKSLSGFVICLLGMIPAMPAAEEGATNLPPAAVDLWKASGGDNWSKVKEIDFNFVVEGDGKQLFSAA